jgi:hypothetical protein
MLKEMDTQLETEVPVQEEQKLMAKDIISLQLGRIDQAGADALVCPQDSRFAGTTLEAELLAAKYGKEPFKEARELYGERMDSLKNIGEKGVNTLPPGFARWTDVPENEHGVRQIIQVVLREDPEFSLSAAVANALLEASLSQDNRTVAIPLMGDVASADKLRKNLRETYLGIKRHMETVTNTPIQEVQLVVNVGEELKSSLDKIWASVVDSNN